VIRRFFFRAAFAHGGRDDDVSIRAGDSALCAVVRSILRVFVVAMFRIAYVQWWCRGSDVCFAGVLRFSCPFIVFCCVNIVGVIRADVFTLGNAALQSSLPEYNQWIQDVEIVNLDLDQINKRS
jgi:hypothetical protein